MGQGVAEAERERELSKQALAAKVSDLGARVRRELDWRAKLRRDGVRYAVVGSAVLVVAAAALVIRARTAKKETEEITVASLDDIAKQLTEIRAELARRRRDSSPLWQKLAVRVATSAAGAAGSLAARRAMEGFPGPAGSPSGRAAAG
jgi:hypothetical protein